MTLIQEVTSTPISWQLVSVISIIALFIGWLAYLIIKRPKSRPSADPLMKSMFITGMLLFILVLMDVFVFTDEEFIKKYAFIIFPVLFFVVLSLNFYYRRKLVPLKRKKLEMLASRILREDYDAEPYTSGASFGFGLLGYQRIKIVRGDNPTMVSIFLFMDRMRNKFIVGLDSFVGDELLIKPNANIELIDKMFNKDLADRYDPLRYELIRGLATETLTKPKEQEAQEEEVVR